MKKTYAFSGIDCANCAAKLERKLQKIKNADEVQVNFLTQKLTLEAADDCFDSVLEEALKIIAKKEPDCKVIVK